MRKASPLTMQELGPQWEDPYEQSLEQIERTVNGKKTKRTVLIRKFFSPYELKVCPNKDCHGRLVRAGHAYHRYWDLPVGDLPAMVEIVHQNFHCEKCDRYPTARVPELDFKRGATKRFVDYVVTRALTEPFSQIARETGLHNTSVRDYFLEAVEQWDRQRKPCRSTRSVWLHRLESSRGYCIVADLIAEKPIELVRSNDKLEGFLKALFGSGVNSFAVDLDEHYRAVLQTIAPRSDIFVPRSALLTFSMAEMRELLVWAGRTSSAIRQRNLRKLIQFGNKPGKLAVLRQILIDTAKSAKGRAETACRLYLGFVEVLRATSAPMAEDLFHRWVQAIPAECEPQLSHLLETLNSWQKEIFNNTTFQTTGTDQGLALALRVREIIEEGRGYDYEVLRGKLLYGPTPSDVGSL